jgi:hypothetical protein
MVSPRFGPEMHDNPFRLCDAVKLKNALFHRMSWLIIIVLGRIKALAQLYCFQIQVDHVVLTI